MADKLIRPIRTNPKVTSPYGWRILNGQQQFHNGIDYINGDDTGAEDCICDRMIVSIADGVCIADNDEYDASQRYDVNSKHSLGNYVYIQHVINGVTYYVLYAHMAKNNFNPGDKVKQGDEIGLYDQFGFSFGKHLHLSFYDINWNIVDPTPIILAGVNQ